MEFTNGKRYSKKRSFAILISNLMDTNLALHLFTFNIHTYIKNCHSYTVQSCSDSRSVLYLPSFCIKDFPGKGGACPCLFGATDGVKYIKI